MTYNATCMGHILMSSILVQGAIRLRLPALTRDLETLSNSTEADPFSKFGDSSSDGRDRASSLEALDDFVLRTAAADADYQLSPSPERPFASASLVTLSPSFDLSPGGTPMRQSPMPGLVARQQRFPAPSDATAEAADTEAEGRRGGKGDGGRTPPPRGHASSTYDGRGIATPLNKEHGEGGERGGHLSHEHSSKAFDLMDLSLAGQLTPAAMEYELQRHPYLAERLGLTKERSVQRTIARLLALSGSSSQISRQAFIDWCSRPSDEELGVCLCVCVCVCPRPCVCLCVCV